MSGFMKRPLYCPICGAKVLVDVTTTNFPEVHRLPEHVPATNVNLCAGFVVTVTLDYDKCSKCGCRICKNETGLCLGCFSKEK